MSARILFADGVLNIVFVFVRDYLLVEVGIKEPGQTIHQGYASPTLSMSRYTGDKKVKSEIITDYYFCNVGRIQADRRTQIQRTRECGHLIRSLRGFCQKDVSNCVGRGG